jgi:DNA-binding NtrC family response regulator
MIRPDEIEHRIRSVMEAEQSVVNRFFAAAKKHEVAARCGRTIVYVEDDPDQISLMKTMFACYSKLRVEPASTVEQGKKLITANPARIRCVMVDVCLGVDDTGTGLELLRWLKSEHPAIPVVVLTAHIDYTGRIHEEFPGVDIYTKAAQTTEALVQKITSNTIKFSLAS